jgi:hypothetical protein
MLKLIDFYGNGFEITEESILTPVFEELICRRFLI